MQDRRTQLVRLLDPSYLLKSLNRRRRALVLMAAIKQVVYPVCTSDNEPERGVCCVAKGARVVVVLEHAKVVGKA